jgi:hypothetical protein
MDTPDDWTDEQNRVFTRVHRFMSENPAVFMRPGEPLLSAETWGTLAWNAAWFSAQALIDDELLTIVASDDDETVLASERETAMVQ